LHARLPLRRVMLRLDLAVECFSNVQERLHATMEMRRKYMFEDKNESETKL
jgi:hypothetical protein